jgi:hypothetical protein
MASNVRPYRARKNPNTTIRGVPGVAGGQVPFVPVPLTWQATTRQLCGLYPWAAPGVLPQVGGPIGRHQESHEVVCFDHISWFHHKFIANPSCAIIARPGMGKSTLAAKLMINLVAMGYVLLIPGDTKPDYVELVRKLDGDVRSVRRAGGAAFNPCDPGGMVAAGLRIGTVPGREAEGLALIGEAIARATTLIGGLLELSRKGKVHDYEESCISTALAALYESQRQVPIVADLIAYVEAKPQDLRDLLLARDDDKYDDLTLPLLRSLKSLVGGKFGDVFSRRTQRRDTPVALNIDTSAIKAGDPAFLAAVLMAAWADVYGMVEAEQALADAGIAKRRLYCLTLDELWRVLQLGGTLPERVNELTRLNRTQGVGQIMITHSVRDDASGGLFERAGAILIGGVPHKEVEALSDVMTLTQREKTALQEWWSMSQANLDQNSVPPGAGKFLLKPSGDDPGIPVDVILSSAEVQWGGQDTNRAWRREATA